MSLRQRTRPGLGIIEPCLPSPAKAPPSGPGWLHEIKHDGFRILARRDSAGVRLITRAGNDFSSRFPFIAMAASKLPVRSCLIDGEACRQASEGEGENECNGNSRFFSDSIKKSIEHRNQFR